MTTGERLKAIAKWLRVGPNNWIVCPVCDRLKESGAQLCPDCLRLAADALERAEQQEDETPIHGDNEWLRSVGAHFGKNDKTCISFVRDITPLGRRKTLAVVLHGGRTTLHLIDEDDKQQSFPLPDLDTRGQVLALCKALGINLSNEKEVRKET